ncbi:hypothetical protein K431DRAFT_235238 [Polychaeton citri CBS 116435]|uniref:Mg2+ transporter protein n=1 Tax=Polychaeton citri CBS 116435 TaxID=1314669 RepID=A0A9P4PX23_9PEZI|nr:hypothetical protein K431DRAFT_235238 [Polychaeton citri CBS 116435]
MELKRFQISDSNLEIDRSYDDSTVRFKLLVAGNDKPHKEDSPKLPFTDEIKEIVKGQKWTSDEWEHLWGRDAGGSAALTSHGILSMINLQNLLASHTYQNRHPKVPRDFGILPFNILVRHVSETLSQVQSLSRELTGTEKRIANGDISLDDNGDYKLLNRLNLEHLRLQRRSNFEIELAQNLLKYIDEYQRMWTHLWEGGTGYIEDMREKIEQQTRYSDHIKHDLDVIPRRIKNQSKAIFNFIAQKDNRINIQLAESSRRIAEESRRDNLLNLEIAKQTAQVADETRRDGQAMKTIAVLTLVFLPGTAIASFFSMNMFNWEPGPGEKVVSGYLWIYFAVTVPITLGFLGFWMWWMWFSQKRYQKKHQQGVRDIEKGLKDRLRSATFSW